MGYAEWVRVVATLSLKTMHAYNAREMVRFNEGYKCSFSFLLFGFRMEVVDTCFAGGQYQQDMHLQVSACRNHVAPLGCH